MIFSPEKNTSQNHACTLKTIVNIEQFIFENSGKFSKTELWNNLPKKIMYQSYKIVLDFLINTKKIQILGRKIIWTGNQETFDLSIYTAQNHLPTLKTIINIIEFTSKNSNQFSKTQLWNNLPKKIMYQSYKIILEYLIKGEVLIVDKRKLIFNEVIEK
jgi:hypothetical protein